MRLRHTTAFASFYADGSIGRAYGLEADMTTGLLSVPLLLAQNPKEVLCFDPSTAFQDIALALYTLPVFVNCADQPLFIWACFVSNTTVQPELETLDELVTVTFAQYPVDHSEAI